jgi:hypothetical protein
MLNKLVNNRMQPSAVSCLQDLTCLRYMSCLQINHGNVFHVRYGSEVKCASNTQAKYPSNLATTVLYDLKNCRLGGIFSAGVTQRKAAI